MLSLVNFYIVVVMLTNSYILLATLCRICIPMLTQIHADNGRIDIFGKAQLGNVLSYDLMFVWLELEVHYFGD